MEKWKKLVHELWDGTKVYIVDGNYVRDNISTENSQFVEGGHGYVYDYIPKKEIWIEEMLNRSDQVTNAAHEITEYIMMKYMNIKYEKAHENTLTVENTLRKLEKIKLVTIAEEYKDYLNKKMEKIENEIQ